MSSTSAFVKKLASNDKNVRESSFELLQKYLGSKATSTRLDLLEMEKLWRGLYFAMWFCDKPKPQEDLAENLGRLYSENIPLNKLSTFHEAFWVIMLKEWPTIDKWRVDKYYLLIRRIVRHNLKRLHQENWSEKAVESFLQVLERVPLSGKTNISLALPYHVCDIFLDELELVIFEDLKEEEAEIESIEEKEERIEKYKGLFVKKLEIIENVPVKQLISAFQKCSDTTLLKTLKQKCKTEVLEDKRLEEWGIVENDSSDYDDNEDEEEEWTGF